MTKKVKMIVKIWNHYKVSENKIPEIKDKFSEFVKLLNHKDNRGLTSYSNKEEYVRISATNDNGLKKTTPCEAPKLRIIWEEEKTIVESENKQEKI